MHSRGITRTGLTASLCALTVTVTAALSGAGVASASVPTWSGVSTIPNVSSPTGAAVISSPTGGTLLLADGPYGGLVWPVLAGSPLSSAVTVAAYGQITSQSALSLPNGDAIIASVNSVGQTIFTYRFASGTLGSSITVSGVSSYAANHNELLVTSAGDGASVTSYVIGADGSLTANGASIKIFTDGTLFGESWTALDPDGTAEVLISAVDEQSGTPDYGDGYMAEVQRLNAGAWQDPVQVPGTADADTNSLHVAVAPTGAMIATWPTDVEVNGYYYTTGVYAQIREPGGQFGAPVQLLNQSSVPVGGVAAQFSPHVAAGPDGTLAATVTGDTCPDQQVSTEATSSTDVWIAAPGAPLSSYAVPGTTLSTTSSTSVTALGAGDGEAVVGLHTATIVDSTNVEGGNAYFYGSCGEEEGYSAKQAFSDSAVVLGPNTPAVSQTFGTGGQTGTGAVSDVDVDAAAVDPNGYATVLGSLDTPGSAEYATFGAVGSPLAVATTGSASGTTGSTSGSTGSASGSTGSSMNTTTNASSGGGSTPSTSTGSGQSSSATTTQAPVTPPKQTAAAFTAVTPRIVGQNGNQLVTASNNSDAIENLSIAEYAFASGLTNSLMVRPADAQAAAAKSKLVKIATGRLTLKPHRSGKLTLHLTRAARKLLAKHGNRLSVTLKITTTAPGHRSTVVTRHLVLRLAGRAS
jgi:hypothetical protein